MGLSEPVSFSVEMRTKEMRNAAHNQAQVKVAVYAAQAPSPEVQRQHLQELLAYILIGLSALAALWVG